MTESVLMAGGPLHGQVAVIEKYAPYVSWPYMTSYQRHEFISQGNKQTVYVCSGYEPTIELVNSATIDAAESRAIEHAILDNLLLERQ